MGSEQFDNLPSVGYRALSDEAGMRTWDSGISWALCLRTTALPLIPQVYPSLLLLNCHSLQLPVSMRHIKGAK